MTDVQVPTSSSLDRDQLAALAWLLRYRRSTDDGDPAAFTVEAISAAVYPGDRCGILCHRVLQMTANGLLYRPLPYDQRFLTLTDAGIQAATPVDM